MSEKSTTNTNGERMSVRIPTDPRSEVHKLRLADQGFGREARKNGYNRAAAETQAEHVLIGINNELGDNKSGEFSGKDPLVRAITKYNEPEKVRDFLENYVVAAAVLRERTLEEMCDVTEDNLSMSEAEPVWREQLVDLREEWIPFEEDDE